MLRTWLDKTLHDAAHIAPAYTKKKTKANVMAFVTDEIVSWHILGSVWRFIQTYTVKIVDYFKYILYTEAVKQKRNP